MSRFFRRRAGQATPSGSDQWARAVGPRVVVVAAVAVGVAVWVVAWWALR